MLITVICLLMKKLKLSLKQIFKKSTFLLNFVSKAYLKNLILVNLKKSFKGIEYSFSVYFEIIDKCDIFNIQEYLMIKYNMK